MILLMASGPIPILIPIPIPIPVPPDVITILNRANATVAVASFSLILTVFLNTQLGPDLVGNSRNLLAISPARWATPAVALSYIGVRVSCALDPSRPLSVGSIALPALCLHCALLPMVVPQSASDCQPPCVPYPRHDHRTGLSTAAAITLRAS